MCAAVGEGGVHISPADVHGLADVSGRAGEIVEAAEGAIGEIGFVDAGSSLGHGRVHVEDGVEFFVLDVDFSQRFLRGEFVLGDDGRDRFADEADLADGDQRMIFHAVSVIGAQAFEVVAGQHIDHAGLGLGGGGVNGKNSRARKRAAKNFCPGHVLDDHVTGVDGAAGYFGNAVSAGNGMIDDLEIAERFHFCPRSWFAAWRIAFRIGR